MTQQQIDNLKCFKQQLDLTRQSKDREIDHLNRRIADIEKTCDHKNPDGSSAIEGDFFMLRCTICSWCDL